MFVFVEVDAALNAADSVFIEACAMMSRAVKFSSHRAAKSHPGFRRVVACPGQFDSALTLHLAACRLSDSFRRHSLCDRGGASFVACEGNTNPEAIGRGFPRFNPNAGMIWAHFGAARVSSRALGLAYTSPKLPNPVPIPLHPGLGFRTITASSSLSASGTDTEVRPMKQNLVLMPS